MGQWHGHFGTFTPFYRAWDKLPRVPAPVKEPKKVPVSDQDPTIICGGMKLQQLGLYNAPKDISGNTVEWGAGNVFDIVLMVRCQSLRVSRCMLISLK